MDEPYFLSLERALASHDDVLRGREGAPGVRDLGLLASALDAPRNVFAYDEDADLFDLAAAYAFHLAENQPFLDGNKRTAIDLALLFLDLNGVATHYPWRSLYDAMRRIGTHDLDRAGLAAILRAGG